MAKIGTKQEVWDGVAQHTAGKLTKADLMLNAAGKVVSKKQHANGKRQAGALKHRQPRAKAVHRDHLEGHQAGKLIREQHGKGILGGLLGSLLGPMLGKISPVLGDVAPAIGGLLPF